MNRTWVILGATSIIATEFAKLVAEENYNLCLIGRNLKQLTIIQKDLERRYKIICTVVHCDFSQKSATLNNLFSSITGEFDLFIAQSDFTLNDDLNFKTIHDLINTNILATTLIINQYLNLAQEEYRIIYLSSVAACRGRAKNSLYGASKAAIEIYLQGLQQKANKNQFITIAKLGFINTKQTKTLPKIVYKADAKACAKACWRAIKAQRRSFYFPKFWFFIMFIIRLLPFWIYKKIKF